MEIIILSENLFQTWTPRSGDMWSSLSSDTVEQAQMAPLHGSMFEKKQTDGIIISNSIRDFK